MYSVSPQATEAWRRLLTGVAEAAGVPLSYLEYPAPAPLEDLWCRTDQGAVFMCGLPLAMSSPPRTLVAAPVPAPADFADRAQYWSEFVVRADSPFRSIEDTFGRVIAFTAPGSQSGFAAALRYFRDTEASARLARRRPLYGEIIAPTTTPLGSLMAVVEGAADVAPLDSYALALLRQDRPELTAHLRTVGRTAPTAIPPLVASVPVDGALSTAFLDAPRHPELKSAMDQLLLRRFIRPDPGAYAALAGQFRDAARFWGAHPLAARTHPAFVTNPD